MLGIGGTELIIILIFGFIIFGPEKLPQIGRTVGRAIRQFREASDAANQKFKEEVYDPFKEAVEPYADQIKETSAPLKEDLDAINETLQETKSMFTDPFNMKGDSSKTASSSAGNAEADKAPGIKNMVDDMLHDPFDMKKDAKAAEEASIQESLDKADQVIDALEGKGQPLPDTGGTVKKSLADSLYGLDDAPAAEPTAEPAPTAKGGE